MQNTLFDKTLDEQFVVGETDLAFAEGQVIRMDEAAILFCTEGSARITIDQFSGTLLPNSTMILLPGVLMSVIDRVPEFRMSYCAFSRELFGEAVCRLDPIFFRELNQHPVNNLPGVVAQGAQAWFKMIEYTYLDRENVFRNTIIKNRLQNVMLEIYDKMLRYSTEFQHQTNTSRQVELFHRFASLVHEHCATEREVGFYADRLCISTRYLSGISQHVVHASAKEFIDRKVLIEIKVMLQSTELSVQEIAYRLHFPDQSYLGRFFKKHTGCSPTEYRNQKK